MPPCANSTRQIFKKVCVLIHKKEELMKPREYYESIATVTGCIIGAGILGIPFVVAQAGFWTGMVVLVVLGVASLIVHLLVGEIALKSKGCHQLAGYAELCLGKTGKLLMSISMIVGVYGAMIAYTLGVSTSLHAQFGISNLIATVLFYGVMACVLYGNVGVLGKSEMGMEVVKLGILCIILVFLFVSPKFSVANLSGFSVDKLLVPYGVILFAYIGTAAIPEVREQMKKCLQLTKRAIVIGTLIPMVCYILFAIGVVGVSGRATAEVATVGLSSGLMGFLMQCFAILAMASSFVALAFALKEMYVVDFGMPHTRAWLITLLVPLVPMVVGVHSFVKTLEVTGTFAGGLSAILIVVMHQKLVKTRDRSRSYHISLGFVGSALIIGLFVTGMVYQLFTL